MIDPEVTAFLRVWQHAWSDVPPNAPATVRRAVLERIAHQTREPLPPGYESDVQIVRELDPFVSASFGESRARQRLP